MNVMSEGMNPGPGCALQKAPSIVKWKGLLYPKHMSISQLVLHGQMRDPFYISLIGWRAAPAAGS